MALTVGLAVTVVAMSWRSSSDASAQAAVQRAATEANAARSARFTIHWSEPRLPEETSDPYVEGLMDFVHRRGRITYGGLGEAIYDGDTVYRRIPLPWRSTAPWVRLEHEDDDPLDLSHRAMHNPIGLLEFLRGASIDTHAAGGATVRGTATIRYEGTLDLQRVVERAPPAKQEELEHWLDLLSETSPTRVPFIVWVDNLGVIHRLRLSGSDSDSMTVEYYDFGVAVKVSLPSPNRVISSEQLWAEIGAHSGDGDCNSRDDRTGVPGASATNEPPPPGADSTPDTATASARVRICVTSSRDDG